MPGKTIICARFQGLRDLMLDGVQVLETVAAAVEPNVTDDGGKHVIDYVRCRVIAHASTS